MLFFLLFFSSVVYSQSNDSTEGVRVGVYLHPVSMLTYDAAGVFYLTSELVLNSHISLEVMYGQENGGYYKEAVFSSGGGYGVESNYYREYTVGMRYHLSYSSMYLLDSKPYGSVQPYLRVRVGRVIRRINRGSSFEYDGAIYGSHVGVSIKSKNIWIYQDYGILRYDIDPPNESSAWASLAPMDFNLGIGVSF